MQPHRVLDLDLDFFLDEVEHWRASDGPRLSDDEFHPWSESEVRTFLEERCGLAQKAKITGQFVTHHDEAFLWWRELIEKHLLIPPFEIVHVDAHSDLGQGDVSFKYIMTELLHRPVEERTHPRTGTDRMHAGSYLSFVVACRWVRRVQYLLHPKAGDDFMPFHFKNNDPYSGFLQLKRCAPEDLKGMVNSMYGPRTFDPEPEVPFEMILPGEFQNDQPFTHGLLCHSPAFTPPAADALIPVIKEYFRPAEG